MSLKTIITMLLLGSSSVAVASPMVRDHRDNKISVSAGYQAGIGGNVLIDARLDLDRDHRRHEDRWNPPSRFDQDQRYHSFERFDGRPVLLAAAPQMSLTNDGQAYARIDPRLGSIMSLEINGLGGVQDIHRIVLQFADGTTESIDMRGHLDERNTTMRVYLDRRGVALNGVYVFGYSPTRTALQITGYVR